MSLIPAFPCPCGAEYPPASPGDRAQVCYWCGRRLPGGDREPEVVWDYAEGKA